MTSTGFGQCTGRARSTKSEVVQVAAKSQCPSIIVDEDEPKYGNVDEVSSEKPSYVVSSEEQSREVKQIRAKQCSENGIQYGRHWKIFKIRYLLDSLALKMWG